MLDLIRSLDRPTKRKILVGIDVASALIALVLTWLVVLGRLPGGEDGRLALAFGAVAALGTAGMVMALGLHRVKLNTYDTKGVAESGVVAMAVSMLAAVFNLLVGRPLPDQAFIVFGMSDAVLTIGLRVALKSYVVWLYERGRKRKRVLIYGAGQTGQQLATALQTDNAFAPVGFVDDNPALHGLMINGLGVSSPVKLDGLVKELVIDRVLIAMPSASGAARATIRRRLIALGCDVHTVPSFADLVNGDEGGGHAPGFDPAALMGRSSVARNLPSVNGAYRGRRILVTGAGGTIGTELARQILAAGPARLVILDHSELALYNIERELKAEAPEGLVVPVLGSVCDEALMRRTIREHEIEVVLHAAAYKHVPLVEENPLAGLHNNVFGTLAAARAAAEAGVQRFILVSTDKALEPASVMGASKRIAELVVKDMAARHPGLRFSMVRFGNVLGSSGSVIPLFHEQIRQGGPVTVTDPEMTRYFMTVAEAVSLTLLAGTFARGGEVFALDMGKPVRIEMLARTMIRNEGYTVRDADNPEGDIEIIYTGRRKGEKLHEAELVGSEMLTTPHPKILRAQDEAVDGAALMAQLEALAKAIGQGDVETADALAMALVGARQEGDVPHIRPASPAPVHEGRDVGEEVATGA